MKDISKNIRTLRIKKNMTQDDLAEALYVTRQTVSNYETGRSRPDIDMIIKIAQVLETDANTVIYGPNVPDDRKYTMKELFICSGVLIPLVAFYLIFHSIARELLEKRLFAAPNLLLSLLFAPAIMLLFGWILMCCAKLIFNFTPVKMRCVTYIRRGLIAVLTVYGVVIAPYTVYLIAAMVRFFMYENMYSTFSFPQLYGEILYFLFLAATKHTYIFAIFGAGICMTEKQRNREAAAGGK